MAKTIFIFAAVLVQVVKSQHLITPINYPPIINELLDKCNQPIPSLSPAESDILCKNFASSIQNVILEKFAQNCLRRPVFGQIAGPLINEVSTNLCKCPACSAVNITPNSYSKTFISPAAVSNIINNANGYVNNAVNNCVNNVPFNSVFIPNNVMNSVPVNNANSIILPNNVVRPVSNVQITDLLSILRGLNECSCRGQGVV